MMLSLNLGPLWLIVVENFPGVLGKWPPRSRGWTWNARAHERGAFCGCCRLLWETRAGDSSDTFKQKVMQEWAGRGNKNGVGDGVHPFSGVKLTTFEVEGVPGRLGKTHGGAV